MNKKLKLLSKEILYMGHLVSAAGLQPDPEKVETVRNQCQSREKILWIC